MSARRGTGLPASAALRPAAVALGALVLMWAALLNGQPFFTPDTQAYVRGPDVAVVKLLGERWASPWARQEPPRAAPDVAAPDAPRPAHSYDDKEVMAGRSIYYGALAYLGQLTGGFWLTVFVQALAAAWLTEMALRASGRGGPGPYAVAIAVLAFATPAPFFVADLMPDVWSGVAIGALALLFAAPSRLGRLDRAALTAMTAFAALAHTSHVLTILGATAAGTLAWWATPRDSAPAPGLALAVSAFALTCALAGTFAFSAMVQRSVGAPPISPPFLTARVVADGPGRLYAAERCHAAPPPYAVCAFADRLGSIDTDGFLWDEHPGTGVFAVASPDQRRALAAEQGRFALASTLAHPWLQLRASARNVLLQLMQTDLEDFDYKPNVLADLRAELPPIHRAALERSRAARRGWPIAPLWAEQAAVIWLSLGALAWGLSRGTAGATANRFALLCGAGVLANTLACGVFSDLYGRYQARCIWVLPLCAVVVVAAQAGRAWAGGGRPVASALPEPA